MKRYLAALLPVFAVACAPAAVDQVAAPKPQIGPSYVIGGHVQGLRGIGLSLKISNGDEVKVDDDGKFVFGTWATEGSTYDVVIAREPISPVQSCVVENGTGRISGKNAMDIVVTCKEVSFEDPPSPAPAPEQDLHAAR